MNKNITIIPLGGIEEIGKNATIIEYREEIILFDYGVKFEKEKLLGNILYYPDAGYLENNLHKVKAIFITHGHLDHYGALLYLVKDKEIPIYASPFTASIIEHFFKKNNISYPQVYPMPPQVSFDHLVVKPVELEHSVMDSLGYFIKTEVGNIFLTGDYRYIEQDTLKGLAKEKVTLLISDSTNANKDKKKISDEEIYGNLEELIKTKDRLFISHFSSQISIIKMVLKIALENNRFVIPLGRSIDDMLTILEQSQEIDPYLDILGSIKDHKNYPENKVIFLATGSQGEKNSSLWKLAHKKMANLVLSSKDTLVLSSSVIPGNEIYLDNIINNFYKQGVEVITNNDKAVHASGHAYKKDIEKVISTLKPKYFLPVHGEMKHLIHNKNIALKSGVLPENIFIVENGKILFLNQERCSVDNTLKNKVNVLLNNQPITEEFIEEKKKLAENGMLMVTLYENLEKNQIKIKINSLGLVPMNKKNDLHSRLEKNIYDEVKFNQQAETQVKKKILRCIANVLNYKHIAKPKFITFNFLY